MSDNDKKSGLPVLVLLPLLFFSLVAALFLFQLTLGDDPQSIPTALQNKPAPQTDLPELQGLNTNGTQMPGFSSDDLTAGQVSIVNVFASWCAPCRAEHPFLLDLSKRTDIQMIGLNYKDEPENALRFLGALGNPYDRVGTDEKGRTAIDWGVYGVPETFIVDGKGIIRFKFIGPLTQASYSDVFLPKLDAILALKP